MPALIRASSELFNAALLSQQLSRTVTEQHCFREKESVLKKCCSAMFLVAPKIDYSALIFSEIVEFLLHVNQIITLYLIYL